MNPQEYAEYVKAKMPKTNWKKNVCLAFLIGGGICVLGQLLAMWLKSRGIDEKTAGSWVAVSLILLGSIVTALGWYDNVAKHAGAGTLVPITGFANAIVSPAMEFKTEGHVLGIGAKMFIVAGPVIVFGVVASIIVGVLSMLPV